MIDLIAWGPRLGVIDRVGERMSVVNGDPHGRGEVAAEIGEAQDDVLGAVDAPGERCHQGDGGDHADDLPATETPAALAGCIEGAGDDLVEQEGAGENQDAGVEEHQHVAQDRAAGGLRKVVKEREDRPRFVVLVLEELRIDGRLLATGVAGDPDRGERNASCDQREGEDEPRPVPAIDEMAPGCLAGRPGRDHLAGEDLQPGGRLAGIAEGSGEFREEEEAKDTHRRRSVDAAGPGEPGKAAGLLDGDRKPGRLDGADAFLEAEAFPVENEADGLLSRDLAQQGLRRHALQACEPVGVVVPSGRQVLKEFVARQRLAGGAAGLRRHGCGPFPEVDCRRAQGAGLAEILRGERGAGIGRPGDERLAALCRGRHGIPGDGVCDHWCGEVAGELDRRLAVFRRLQRRLVEQAARHQVEAVAFVEACAAFLAGAGLGAEGAPSAARTGSPNRSSCPRVGRRRGPG